MDYILNLTFLCANGEKSSMSIEPVSPILLQRKQLHLWM